jgi:hypothetical protein
MKLDTIYTFILFLFFASLTSCKKEISTSFFNDKMEEGTYKKDRDSQDENSGDEEDEKLDLVIWNFNNTKSARFG